MITIKPKKIECPEYWDERVQGVIFVETEEEIEPLWKALCEQDDYWEDYRKLIEVAPKEIDRKEDLRRYCRYVGKTDIYNMKELKKDFNFIIFQYHDDDYYR